jgi:hypothetical protein
VRSMAVLTGCSETCRDIPGWRKEEWSPLCRNAFSFCLWRQWSYTEVVYHHLIGTWSEPYNIPHFRVLNSKMLQTILTH